MGLANGAGAGNATLENGSLVGCGAAAETSTQTKKKFQNSFSVEGIQHYNLQSNGKISDSGLVELLIALMIIRCPGGYSNP